MTGLVPGSTSQSSPIFKIVMFTINSKWYVIIGGQKNNFNDLFKLELIITYHLKFVVDVLLLKNMYIQIFISVDIWWVSGGASNLG